MLNADYKLVPVASADYIEQNKPELYIKGIPCYAIGVTRNVKAHSPAYQRAYFQTVKLFDLVVKRKASSVVSTQRWRDNRPVNVRKE